MFTITWPTFATTEETVVLFRTSLNSMRWPFCFVVALKPNFVAPLIALPLTNHWYVDLPAVCHCAGTARKLNPELSV